jgi:AdoMet-dependent heme synthase
VKSLMHEMGARALRLGIPLGVQLDLTYTCNERCVHCYLDHEDHGELSTEEVLELLDQLAAAGVFYLTLSGGEIFMRKDFFAILERARRLSFAVKLKTNAVMVTQRKARRIAALGVESVQVSLYSHRAEVHDAITKLPGSFARTLAGTLMLRDAGVKVSFANIVMRDNADDYAGVHALCESLGIEYKVDATITPMMDGDRSILALNVDAARLAAIHHDPRLADVAESCAPPAGPLDAETAFDTIPCTAGHSACYISPYGDVYPCVQFPLACGNVREQRFIDIWRTSPQLAQVRSITMGDLHGCSSCVHGSSCSRCPGLAYMEGDMRGPSVQDCERSYARTGVPSRNLLAKKRQASQAARPVIWLVAKPPVQSD